jgi:hypothetical protein
MRRSTLIAAAAVFVALVAAGPAAADEDDRSIVRFATFNAFLNRNAPGQLVADLSTPDNPQAAAVAEIIQRTRPDVLSSTSSTSRRKPSASSRGTTSRSPRTARARSGIATAS